MPRMLRFSAVPHHNLTQEQVGELLNNYRGQHYAAVTPRFAMRSGMVYTQVRAISARVNQNYDGWPSNQLKKYYKTFIGKPIFVNHGNDDPQRARGRVIAARYVEKGADKYVEVIQEVDGKRYPRLAKEIISGGLDSVSMGVEAGFTICSVCDNKATDLHDMCDHIALHKGEHMRNKRTGKKTLVYEKCYKLGFFELSYVFDPADETAVVSRVIAASNRSARPVQEQGGNDGLPVQPWFQPKHEISDRETDAVWDPDSHAYQDHAPPNTIKRNLDPSDTQIYDNASIEEKAHLDPLDFYSPYQAPKEHYQVPQRLNPSSRTSMNEGKRAFMTHWYKKAFGETKAPEDIDTLRDESEDDTDLFHHWVESPPELQAPNMDATERLDREQESQGLDQGRNSENVEDVSGPPMEGGQQQEPMPPQEGDIPGQEVKFLDDEDQDPVMPINPPEFKKSRRTQKGVPMSRYYYAADDEEGYEDSAPEDSAPEDDSAAPDSGGDEEGGGDDIGALLNEAEADIEAFENGGDVGSGDDSGGEDDGSGDDFGGGDFEEGGEEPQDDSGEESGGGEPPWLSHEGYRRSPVRKARSQRNKRGGAMSGSTLSERARVASRGQRHADVEGGPYGVDDSQGAQEDVFISQVPSAEAVAAPVPGDGQISNSPGNLVAYKRPQFDPNHYQHLAEVVKALPPEYRGSMAKKMVTMFTADNKSFNGRTFYEEARVPMVRRGNRYFYAEDLVDPDKVNPSLSGTDVQDLKGKDFESLALDDVETQPKDASIHAFRVFDQWLANATGRTARQHANANFIRRAAASYASSHQDPQGKLASLFPTLEFVLAEARKFEGGAQMRRQAEDQSLSVAAPQDRIDVEAPVKNVTDEKAQASQFDLGDFAHNAGDQLADPVLDVVDGNAGTWAPDKGKESAVKLATAAEAVRLADAYIAAYPNKYSDKHRWELTAQFETMRQPVVRDRIRVLEAVTEDQSHAPARKVAAATSRGTTEIPRGLGSRTARRKVSATDPDTDYGLFI